MKGDDGKLSKIQIRRLTYWKKRGAVTVVGTDPQEMFNHIKHCESNW